MQNAEKLAQWIRAQLPYRREALTHLKLQKLSFYCYGAALAFGAAEAVGTDIVFEAWDHGPVCREIWERFRQYGKTPIPFLSPSAARTYAPEVEEHLLDALRVYGPLQAWSLRQESHLEEPWIRAFKDSQREITSEELRAHFKKKFTSGTVQFPEYLLHASSARLDGIPVAGRPSLRALGETVLRLATPHAV
ncbi:MAG: DUF4065 domain-containing protein [Myxococcales bacterium]|nr:DUF4065 domain-containing protein [Myxococcales bacterium]